MHKITNFKDDKDAENQIFSFIVENKSNEC